MSDLRTMVKIADGIALEVFRNYLIRRDGVLFDLAEIEVLLEDHKLGIKSDIDGLDESCLQKGTFIRLFRKGLQLCYGDEEKNRRCAVRIYGIMNATESLYNVRAIEYVGWSRRRDITLVRWNDPGRVERIVGQLESPETIERSLILRVPRAHLSWNVMDHYLPDDPEEFCRLRSQPIRYIRLPSLKRLKEPFGPRDPQRIVCALFGEGVTNGV